MWKVIFDHFPPFLPYQKKRVTDGPTDRRTDGPTDGRTDIPSYRDAWTHLKTRNNTATNVTTIPNEAFYRIMNVLQGEQKKKNSYKFG